MARRLPRWPAVVAFAIPLSVALWHASPFGTSLVSIFVVWPLLLVWYLAIARSLAAALLGARDWRRSTAYYVLPAIALAIGIMPGSFFEFCNSAGDELYFAMWRDHYMTNVKSRPDTDEAKLIVFNRGGMLWSSYGLIYDESDELRLPEEQRSAAWRARADKTEMVCGYRVVHSLGSHFYSAGFMC